MSMKYSTSHNIICLEAEWEYTEHTDNKFSLNTQPMLNWLKESYECDIIYRRIRTKADLKHYLDYFNHNPEEFYKYDLIYIACHGEKKALWIEGKDISLSSLANMARGFFADKVIHFSSCQTLSNKLTAKEFKKNTGAKLVSGYKIPVNPQTSSICDIAYLNDILSSDDEIDITKYCDEDSDFWTRYSSLLTELRFTAI